MTMFSGCKSLKSFKTTNLDKVNDPMNMFYGCSSLKVFEYNLPAVTYTSRMFMDCTGLESFTAEMPAITDGSEMFMGCTNLTNFTSSLGSLTNGKDMFTGCKLNASSVEKILTTIPTITTGKKLGMTIQPGAAAKFGEITGTTPTSTEIINLTYKGWAMSVNLSE
jgi:hypothetical protein